MNLSTKTLLFLALGLLLFRPASADAKPNVIIFMVDDLDVRSYQDLLRGNFLPHIKRELVDKGTSFDQSFVTNAVCCPSRATMLTGQYTKNHGVLTVARGIGYWLSGAHAGGENHTLATWLKAAGYRTAHLGKYLNGYGYLTAREYVPPGYDEWHGLLDPGTYQVYNYSINENGVPRRYGQLEKDYQTDVLAFKAGNIINGHFTERPNQPLFMVLTPMAPHIELGTTNKDLGYAGHFYETIRPAPRHLRFVDGDPSNGEVPAPTLQPSFNEADVSDKPAFFSELPGLDDAARAAMVSQYKNRLAAMMAVDDMFGKVVAALAAQKQLDNTVILFTSDNGYFFGEHRLSSKLFAYEESARVPLVIRGPGFAQGRTSSAIALNIDIAPTVTQLSGAVPSRVVDGRSLVSILRDPSAPWSRKQFLIEHYQEQSADGSLGDLSPESNQAIRRITTTDNALYVQWYENPFLQQVVTFFEFYDLRLDPYQLANSHPGLPNATQCSWATLMSNFRTCRGAACRTLEDQ